MKHCENIRQAKSDFKWTNLKFLSVRQRDLERAWQGIDPGLILESKGMHAIFQKKGKKC